jgi:hypothetical protein
MKLNDAMKIVDKGWIRKPKGFRVRFQKRIHADVMTEYVPGTDDKPLESDVVAWRLAWKLAQAQKGDRCEPDDEKLFNILVVDDLDNPMIHYGTGEPEVFLPEE